MTLHNINSETKEGRLLIMAVAVLTQSPKIILNDKIRRGSSMTPDEVLEELIKMENRVYKEVPISQ